MILYRTPGNRSQIWVCLLERVWKRLFANCESQFVEMIFQTRSNTSSIEISFMRNPLFLILYHIYSFLHWTTGLILFFLLFSRILSALRAVYTAPFISVQFILYMQKRNVLSKSFLFVCRLFYFSNFSITHVCVFVFLS